MCYCKLSYTTLKLAYKWVLGDGIPWVESMKIIFSKTLLGKISKTVECKEERGKLPTI